LLADLGSEEEPKNTSEQIGPRNFLENVVGKINEFVGIGESINWSHYQSGKAAEIIKNNLNSKTPDPELLAMVNSYGQNLIALILAQARLPDWVNVEEIYKPYFDITEITGEIAQIIKEIIKNAIRDHLTAKQPVNDGLIKAITNQIINELQTLAIDPSDENVELVLQIQQLLKKDSGLISNLEQLVQEILSDSRKTDSGEAQEPEQTNFELDTRINQLKIVLATQPSSPTSEQGLLQRLSSLPNRNFGLPTPASWLVSPVLGAIIGNLTRELGFNWIYGAISVGISGLIGVAEGRQHARRILEMAAEAQAANNPEQPLTNQPKFYEMISAKDLFKKIQDAFENPKSTKPELIQESKSAKPELIQELLLQIHLIRILWNEYQYPILENDLEPDDLEKIQKLAKQHRITLESNENPLVFYRNLLLLVEVLGIELIQKTQQAMPSESGPRPNPETFWHQTGLNRLRKAVTKKIKEINQALGFKNHLRLYLSEAFKKAIISALFSFLPYEASTIFGRS